MSAFGVESDAKAFVTGYLDSRGARTIFRYLHSNSGDEFENWLDAKDHADGFLPGGHWRIGAQFLPYPPSSGIVGHAGLQVDPVVLPAVDFARESGMRRVHHRGYVIDVRSRRHTPTSGWWETSFVVRTEDGRSLEPMSTGAIDQSRERAIYWAIENAQLLIDAGITMPETASPAGP